MLPINSNRQFSAYSGFHDLGKRYRGRRKKTCLVLAFTKLKLKYLSSYSSQLMLSRTEVGKSVLDFRKAKWLVRMIKFAHSTAF